ncbi:GNAT family N-acetyltransferase [Candidatus Woesebacteria bacterium]|nr:GNAT family N-acetyltransferase [Candidatus Woesebacteria bacterium]MCD8507124.1 GNAT family N-acetyltransferase [Candidatus Woesebacteria bacterium]MCD8526903.1 GNAT family N-acetyltransferase [Candidatus Woesebacteria bacterium]MCD8546053.1 GNAT family N-acetyltransferase [Candidatus Woesebacteria bacterium]
MILHPELLVQYHREIEEMYFREFKQTPDNTFVYFGIFAQAILQAAATLKWHKGHWFLQGCVVKPEYRGQGLQRRLIEERVEYIQGRASNVLVVVHPHNYASRTNIERSGFTFLDKTQVDGDEVHVYIRYL